MWKTHAASRFCAEHIYYPIDVLRFTNQDAAGCCLLPLIWRPLSVMERKEKGDGGERGISSVLWWQMGAGIKSPQLIPWTIHYGEGDILLCQQLEAIWTRTIDKGLGQTNWPGGNWVSLGHFFPQPNAGQKVNEWFRLKRRSIAHSINDDSLPD